MIAKNKVRKTGRLTVTLILLVSVMLSALSLTSCTPRHKSKTLWECFGDTYFTFHDYSGMSSRELDSVFSALSVRLEYYGRLFDIYNEYSGMNNLKTVNDRAGEAVEVAPEIIELIELSKNAYDLTAGEVNIAFGAVLSLWHDAR